MKSTCIIMREYLVLGNFTDTGINYLSQYNATLIIITQAFIVGSLGSAAYFSAVYFTFIENKSLCPILIPNSRVCKGKLLWYMAMGGVIALIFQLPERNGFIPIQAFILGTTWPSIVAQILTGKLGPEDQNIQLAKKGVFELLEKGK